MSGSAGGGPSDRLATLQGLLAVEHAAAWGWGVAGAELDGAARELAREAVAAHLARRDRLRALVRDLGAEPVAASAAYELPDPPPVDVPSALALGLLLEEGTADAQARALGVLTDRAQRAALVAALTGAAVRAMRVRALLDPAAPATVAFPGAAGLPRPLPTPSPPPTPPAPSPLPPAPR